MKSRSLCACLKVELRGHKGHSRYCKDRLAKERKIREQKRERSFQRDQEKAKLHKRLQTYHDDRQRLYSRQLERHRLQSKTGRPYSAPFNKISRKNSEIFTELPKTPYKTGAKTAAKGFKTYSRPFRNDWSNLDNIASGNMTYSVNVKGNKFAFQTFQEGARRKRKEEEEKSLHRRKSHSDLLAAFRKKRRQNQEKERALRPSKSQPLICDGPDRPRRCPSTFEYLSRPKNYFHEEEGWGTDLVDITLPSETHEKMMTTTWSGQKHFPLTM